MVKFKKLFLLILTISLIYAIPKDTFAAPSVASADFNYQWSATSVPNVQNLTYNNYSLGNYQLFGSDAARIYWIHRIGGGVNFNGTSGEPYVTARVKFRIYGSTTDFGYNTLNYSCMQYSAGMSQDTATIESTTNIMENGIKRGEEIVCSYGYKSSTPYYHFFGLQGTNTGGKINVFEIASNTTYASYQFLDLQFNDTSGASTIIYQNSVMINQNENIINNQIETNEKLDELNEAITSDDVNADSKLDDLFSGKIDYTSTPIIGIFRMPITFLQKILNSVNGTCSSFNLGRFEFANYNFVLPCITPSRYLTSNNFDLWTIITGLFNMFMIYNIGVLMLRFYECVTDLKSPLYLLFGRSFDSDDKRNS